MSYAVSVEALAPDVSLSVELLDRDGLTRLEEGRVTGTFTWRAAATGSYFRRVTPTAGSGVGCDATYRVTLAEQ